ncbi:DUF6531 domain-containing protein [Paraburkholderia sp. IW21]|uniref:DUF6531 domain-containing protein n=1 Tax=Paraburkholderia sp. IW21 TaxID=3242488 RepID=UPI003521D618
MNDKNLGASSTGILFQRLTAFLLLLVAFGARAGTDEECLALYPKSHAIRGTQSCPLDVSSNTPIGLGTYDCVGRADLIIPWCAGTDLQPEKSCPVADPVYPGSGTVTLSSTDFVSGDDMPMVFSRTYRSTPLGASTTAMGPVWFHNWQRQLGLANANSGSSSKVLAYRENGEPLTFNWSAGTWRTAAFSGLELTQNGAGWTLTDLSTAITETYSAQGIFLSERTKTGFVRTLTYDGSGRLTAISQHGDDAIAKFDLTLRLDYDDKGRLVRLTDPANGLTQYGYDANSNLVAVMWPDGNVRRYVYDDTRFRNTITGEIDETGTRIATWSYDALGRAASVSHPDTTRNVQFAYGSESTAVTDSQRTTTLNFSSIGGMLRPTGSRSSSGSTSSTWDASGRLLTDTTATGSAVEYSYDSAGRPSRVTTRNASGTTYISTRYAEATALSPSMVASPGKLRAFVYDTKGNLTGYSERKTNDPTGASGFDAVWDGRDQRTIGARYDELNRMTGAVVFDNGAKSAEWVYFYDSTGNLNTAQNLVSHWLFGNQDRDAAHRVTWQTGNYREARIGYDARGRVTRFNYDEAATPLTGGLHRAIAVNYAYSANGQNITRTGTITQNDRSPAILGGVEIDRWLDNYEGGIDPVGPPAGLLGWTRLTADWQTDRATTPVCIECWLMSRSPLGLAWSMSSDNTDTLWFIPGLGVIKGIAKVASNLCKSSGLDNSAVINFQTRHYESRLKAEGLEPARVESSIAQEVQTMIPNLEKGSNAWGRMTIDGIVVEFRLYVKSNGEINVGTIFPVKGKP